MELTFLNMLSIKLTLTIEIILVLDRVYLNTGVSRELVRDWVKEVERRVAERGGVDTIAWIKLIRLSCTRYLCGTPLTHDPSFGIKIAEDGLPAREVVPECVTQVINLVRDKDSDKVRLLLTLLNVSRVIPGWKSPDLSPITTPTGSSKHCLRTLSAELVAVAKEMGLVLTVPKWERCHLSTKAGPNAQALVGSVEDATLLPPNFRAALRIIGGEELLRTIANIRQISPLAWLTKLSLVKTKGPKANKPVVPMGRLAKVSLVKDKEAKCRIVAILDYWSQSALKPLHDSVMNLLRSFGPDCTFSQGSFRNKLPKKGPYYSFDLSSATDRLPVVIQEALLAYLISPSFAAAWRHLIVDRDYNLTWGNRAATVRYACGQPMGAYSSWPVFSLTHHVIVRLAAKRAGCGVSFTKYVLLGDDIVIADARVAEEYRKIISQLGVEISTVKTHVSNDAYEFAKRWIHNGKEVTGAPLGSLFEGIRVNGAKLKQAFPGQKSRVTVNLAKQDPAKFVAYASYYTISLWIGEVEGRWLARSRTLVSRGLLASIFKILITNPAVAARLADKAWRYFLVPARADTRHLRRVKSETLASILLGDALSCNLRHTSSAYVSLMAYLIACKARTLENAIKRQVGALRDFQLEVAKWADLVPEGLDAQSLLLSLPPVAVLRSAIASLQLEFDKLRGIQQTFPPQKWLHLELRLFVDPLATLSTRTSKVVASNTATILNVAGQLAHGIAGCRAMLLDDSIGDALIEKFVADVTTGGYVFRRLRRAEILRQRSKARKAGSKQGSSSKTRPNALMQHKRA